MLVPEARRRWRSDACDASYARTLSGLLMPITLVVLVGMVVVIGGMELLTFSEHGAMVAATASSTVAKVLRRGRGRPKKFDEPTRVVTLTLPESAVSRLLQVHSDLARAVLGLIDTTAPGRERGPAELVVFGRHAVISVRHTPTLERRIGVQLVPLPDGRALISFDSPRTVAELELAITDALDDRSLQADDRAVFEGIAAILRDARRDKHVVLQHRNIIVLEGAKRTRVKAIRVSNA